MNIARILISGVVVWVVSTVLGFLSCGWLFNWVYLLPPNIWLDETAMMSACNIVGANIAGFIRALLFAFVYAVLYKGIPGTGAKKGMIYGILVWLVGALAGVASRPFYITIATTVVVYWIIQALVLNIINGAILGVIYRER